MYSYEAVITHSRSPVMSFSVSYCDIWFKEWLDAWSARSHYLIHAISDQRPCTTALQSDTETFFKCQFWKFLKPRESLIHFCMWYDQMFIRVTESDSNCMSLHRLVCLIRLTKQPRIHGPDLREQRICPGQHPHRLYRIAHVDESHIATNHLVTSVFGYKWLNSIWLCYILEKLINQQQNQSRSLFHTDATRLLYLHLMADENKSMPNIQFIHIACDGSIFYVYAVNEDNFPIFLIPHISYQFVIQIWFNAVDRIVIYKYRLYIRFATMHSIRGLMGPYTRIVVFRHISNIPPRIS